MKQKYTYKSNTVKYFSTYCTIRICVYAFKMMYVYIFDFSTKLLHLIYSGGQENRLPYEKMEQCENNVFYIYVLCKYDAIIK